MHPAITTVTYETAERRRRHRDDIERLLDRASHLPATDRVLVEQVYRHGVPVVDIARLSGQPPRKLRRRLARLLKRMNSPLFAFLIRHGDQLPQPLRRTGELIVLEGHSLRRAVSLSEQSLHRVREHLRTLQTLAQL